MITYSRTSHRHPSGYEEAGCSAATTTWCAIPDITAGAPPTWQLKEPAVRGWGLVKTAARTATALLVSAFTPVIRDGAVVVQSVPGRRAAGCPRRAISSLPKLSAGRTPRVLRRHAWQRQQPGPAGGCSAARLQRCCLRPGQRSAAAAPGPGGGALFSAGLAAWCAGAGSLVAPDREGLLRIADQYEPVGVLRTQRQLPGRSPSPCQPGGGIGRHGRAHRRLGAPAQRGCRRTGGGGGLQPRRQRTAAARDRTGGQCGGTAGRQRAGGGAPCPAQRQRRRQANQATDSGLRQWNRPAGRSPRWPTRCCGATR